MHPRMIFTIFRKDLKDAIRDSRVLIALVLPFGIGIFYSLTFDDDNSPGKLDATVAYTSPDPTGLPEAITAIVGGAVDVTYHPLGSPVEVRAEVDDEDADVGIVAPAGFDDALRVGQQPQLTVMTPSDMSIAGSVIVEALDPAVRQMAGVESPVQLDVQAAPAAEDEDVLDRIGLKSWAVVGAVVMMIGMVAILVVPVVLAEEAEKKTLDALVLIANYTDVIIAKALLGIVYLAFMVPILMTITGVGVDEFVMFYGAAALLSIALLGFGLLLGSLFRSANQLNTWSGIILLPVIAPAFAIALPAPQIVTTLAESTPTGQATKLMLNGVSGERLYSNIAAPIAVICLYGVVAYALLLWDMRRREA
jgi:ABC-2 type transport system permease protein